MENLNFALVTALYTNSRKGLYSDIYFPIIKYAIVKIYTNKKDTIKYCSLSEIHDFINEKFNISIPHIVIEKSTQQIAKHGKDFEINFYEDGNTFQILSAQADDMFEDVERKESNFSDGLALIEEKYQEYLTTRGVYNDGVTFIQYITANTEDVLGYFENERKECVDEKYTTLIFFLEHIRNENKDLFTMANQLFWGSVIAAYLQSEKPQVDSNIDGVKGEFFLDTSIVMGILGLSSSQRAAASNDVLDIIKTSGSIARVHPMTIEEISCILLSVEQNGPYPFSEIAIACQEKKLTPAKLAKIRLNLYSDIEKLGISVFPNMGANEKFSIKNKYKGSKKVKLLAEYRAQHSNNHSYSEDNYREIHDIFIDDYISERRKKASNDRIFFLTSNRDLISFCRDQHPNENNMISTGRLTLELWMHNAQSSQISTAALTESMARCLDLHRIGVRQKLAEVSAAYNQNKDGFDEELYKDFLQKLYYRAKNVILTIESNPDNEDTIGKDWINRITEAVRADQDFIDAKLVQAEGQHETDRETIKQRETQIADLENQYKQVQQRLNEAENARRKEVRSRELAEKRSTLLQEKDELKNKLERMNADLVPFIQALERCCSRRKRLIWIAIVCIITLSIVLVITAPLEEKINNWWFAIIAPLSGTLYPLLSLEKEKQYKENKKKKLLEKSCNKRFLLLIQDIEKTERRLNTINLQLTDLA